MLEYTYGNGQLGESNTNNTAHTIQHDEAEVTVNKVQYEQILGKADGTTQQQREALVKWTIQNKDLLAVYHRIHSISDNVDYSRTIL